MMFFDNVERPGRRKKGEMQDQAKGKLDEAKGLLDSVREASNCCDVSYGIGQILDMVRKNEITLFDIGITEDELETLRQKGYRNMARVWLAGAEMNYNNSFLSLYLWTAWDSFVILIKEPDWHHVKLLVRKVFWPWGILQTSRRCIKELRECLKKGNLTPGDINISEDELMFYEIGEKEWKKKSYMVAILRNKVRKEGEQDEGDQSGGQDNFP